MPTVTKDKKEGARGAPRKPTGRLRATPALVGLIALAVAAPVGGWSGVDPAARITAYSPCARCCGPGSPKPVLPTRVGMVRGWNPKKVWPRLSFGMIFWHEDGP